jgi:hypothetical protein
LEGGVRKGTLCAIGALAILTGCEEKAANVPVPPKWKGPPYHIALDPKPAKPNPAGVTIPAITYNANPDALERRAALVVRLDASGVKSDQPIRDQMVMAPVDISGAEGALPASYLDSADQSLAKLLAAYCMKGKVKITVLLVRSSVSPQAGDAELNDKRLSDWLPIELDFKNPHAKC